MRHPSRPPGSRVIRVLAALVPWWKRDAWVAEWEGELAWAASSGGAGFTHRMGARLRALTALRDAMWHRHRHGRQAVFTTDLIQALRALRKRPGYALTVVLTLGLGIGGATAVFSVVDAVLLRPLPYVAADRLVSIYRVLPRGGSVPDVRRETIDAWRSQAGLFDGIELYDLATGVVTGLGEPREENVVYMSAGALPLLGVPPLRGRFFTAAEETEGARVALVDERFWRTTMGGRRDVIGAEVTIEEQQYEVIGVMPRGFRFPLGSRAFWMPMRPEQQRSISGLGRLREGVTIDAARERIEAIAVQLEQERPSETGWAVSIHPLDDRQNRAADAGPLWMLGYAVLAVLLIGCANAANLLLVQGAKRARELNIRGALGATRWRLVRLVLTECVILCVAAASAGALVAMAGVRALRMIAPSRWTMLTPVEIGVDGRVLGFAVVLAVCTGLLFGIGPAIVASGRRAQLTGVERAGSGTRSMRRTRTVLAAAELALAMALLMTASLLIRSFAIQMRTDLGIETQRLAVLEPNLPASRYPDVASKMHFYDQLTGRLRALPGVQEATLAEAVPPSSGFSFGLRLEAEGAAPPSEGQPELMMVNRVDDAYLDVLDIPLVAGRGFDERDAPGTEPVALIDVDLARFLWPDITPSGVLNRRFRLDEDAEWLTVVGVVESVVLLGLNRQLASMCGDRCAYEAYRPLRQAARNWDLSVALRTTNAPADLARIVNETMWSIDPNVPVRSFATMEQRLLEELDEPRFLMRLVMTFTFIALGLSALGVYAVLAYAVAMRTREIGVRIALGAQPRDVVGGILTQAGVFVLCGILGGVAAAVAVARLLDSLLHGVAPADPLSLGASAAILCIVALVASFLPARRATRVSPLDALRLD